MNICEERLLRTECSRILKSSDKFKAKEISLKIVKKILKNEKTNVNAINCEPLLRAIESGNLEVVKLLMSHSKINLNHGKNTLICHCTRNGDLMKLLLTKFDPSLYSNKVLKSVAHYCDLEVFKVILGDSRVDPCCDNYEVFRILWGRIDSGMDIGQSLENGKIKFVSKKPDVPRFFPLMEEYLKHEKVGNIVPVLVYIISEGLYNEKKRLIMEILELKGFDISFHNDYFIRKVCRNYECKWLVKLLLEKNINPGANKSEALKNSLKRGNFEITKLLLEDKRVDPSCRNNYPIRFCCQRRREVSKEIVEIAKILLKKKGVKPSARNREAFKNKNVELQNLLKEWEERQKKE